MSFIKTRSFLSLGIFILLLSICCLIISCDTKLVDVDSSDSPYDLILEKTAEGQIRLSWNFNVSTEDTVRFDISKRVGVNPWITGYISTYEYFIFDNIPTNDTLVYAYRIKAVNESLEEESNYSEVIAFFSEFTYPGDIQVQQNTQDQLLVSWTDNSLGEEGFFIDKKTGEGDWQNRYRVFPANTTSFNDPANLFETVSYRVSAFAGVSETPDIEASFLPTLPAPSDLILQKPDPARIKLLWTDNSDGEEGFSIDRKVGGLAWQTDYAFVDSNTTVWIDEIDQPCGTFTYRVRAFHGEFTSLFSNEESTNVYLEEIGTWETDGEALDVFISEDTNWYTFIADKYYGFTVIDCVNPSEPFGMNYNQGGLPDRTRSIFVRDQLGYIVTDSGLNEHGMLYIVDLSPIIPFHPFEQLPPPEVLWIVGSCSITADEDDTFIPYDIFLDGDYAYVADGENGLVVIYIATSDPGYITDIQTGGIARNVFVKNNKAYVSTKDNGLVVVNVNNPENPSIETNYPTTGLTMDAKERDGYIYVADGENGLKIINTFNSDVSYIATDGFANAVYVQGEDRYQEDHVYLSDKEKGLFVIDISDPDSPFILGHYTMDTEPVAISKFFQSSYVFLADNDGLKIVQVAP